MCGVHSFCTLDQAVIFPGRDRAGCRLRRVVVDKAANLPDGAGGGENADEDARRFYRPEQGIVLVTKPSAGQAGEELRRQDREDAKAPFSAGYYRCSLRRSRPCQPSPWRCRACHRRRSPAGRAVFVGVMACAFHQVLAGVAHPFGSSACRRSRCRGTSSRTCSGQSGEFQFGCLRPFVAQVQHGGAQGRRRWRPGSRVYSALRCRRARYRPWH